MALLLLQGICVVLAWIGLWGLIELLIDRIVKDDTNIRIIVYILITLLAIMILWITGAF